MELSPGARSILEAATEAFARAGFDSVSLTDVAAQAKVSKANIFHHFKSKEALYVEVMREACKGHAEFAEALLARSDLSSTEKLRQLIEFDLVDLFGNEKRSHLVVREIMNTGCQTGRSLIQPVFMRNVSAVVGLIAQGQASGEFDASLDPEIIAVMIGGTVMMMFQNRGVNGLLARLEDDSGLAAHADKVFRTILKGVAARADKPSSTSRKRVPQ